ncbi:UNVERIFIED_CONTAM: hypothetical protein FKN15_071470 [Acipenser sinensis]
MSKDIEDWISKCDKCQKVGKLLHVDSQLQNVKVSAAWELLDMDLTESLPQTKMVTNTIELLPIIFQSG